MRTEPVRLDVKLPPWSGEFPKGSILDDRAVRGIAISISGHLHYCTGIPACDLHQLCVMCGDAVRLVMQAAEPRLIDAVLTKAARSVGRGDMDLHPVHRGDD